MTAASAGGGTVELAGCKLEYRVAGSGREILFLSSGIWLGADDAFVDHLAKLGRVTAPVHPGYGKLPIPNHLTSADDLAYLYLDLVDHLRGKSGRGVVIVAGSLGGFIAAEMAVKSCQGIDGLVLIDAAGVKAGGRHDRDYVDLFAHTENDLVDMTFANPAPYRVELPALSEVAVTERVQAREALARFVWQPYMHDPRLAGRLHRVTTPTLVLHGAKDRIVDRACSELYASAIPGARLQIIDGAGHLPHVEQPAATLAAISRFVDGLAGTKSHSAKG